MNLPLFLSDVHDNGKMELTATGDKQRIVSSMVAFVVGNRIIGEQ